MTNQGKILEYFDIFLLIIKVRRKDLFLQDAQLKKKIPGWLNKKEINKFYDNIIKGKEITVKQLGPNGFLISQ